MPRWLRFVHSLRWPLSVLIVLAMALFAWYAIPKKQVLTGPYSGVAYYRGFGLTNNGGIWGKHFYAADFTFEHEHDYWYTKYDVQSRGGGRAYFKGYYKHGAIAYEGECLIAFSPQGHPSQLDLMCGPWVKYYKPDGTLGSQAVDGTGLHVWWTQNGEKTAQIETAQGKQLYVTRWYPSGQLRVHLPFVDGMFHGEAKQYWPNGRVKSVVAYEHGRPVGTSISYKEDGSIESETVHTEP